MVVLGGYLEIQLKQLLMIVERNVIAEEMMLNFLPTYQEAHVHATKRNVLMTIYTWIMMPMKY